MNNKLRSADWFGKSDKMGFVHRSWLRNQGYPDDYFRGKPVIGICNTWSELISRQVTDWLEQSKHKENGKFNYKSPEAYVGIGRCRAQVTQTFSEVFH